MSYSVEFYGGDPARIARAVSDLDLDVLDDERAFPLKVDFSLRLGPEDFDVLTEAIRALVGSGPSSFVESFEETVFSNDEVSVDVLSLEWATMVASVPGDACDKVVDQWVKALAKNYGDPQMKPTDELRCAFAALVELCRRAKAERLPVVHVFML